MKPFSIALTAAGVAALASAPLVIPNAIQSVSLLAQPDNVAEIADYQLRMVSPERFQSNIEQALADGDPELAASLVEVAADLKVQLPSELIQQVTDAQSFDAGRMAGEVLGGFFTGDTSSEAAFGGSLAADLTGFGDARDLVVEGNNYIINGTFDPVVLALATVGLTATAATWLTAGGASPARTGVTILKTAKKADRIPAPLLREMSEVAVKAIDGPALEQAITAAKRFDIPAASTAASRVLNPAATQKITQLADDAAGIFTQSGYRGFNQTLQVVGSAEDVAKMRRLSAVKKTKFRGTLKVLGSVSAVSLTLGSIITALIGWTSSGVAWLVAAGFAIFGFAYRMIRVVRKWQRDRNNVATLGRHIPKQ